MFWHHNWPPGEKKKLSIAPLLWVQFTANKVQIDQVIILFHDNTLMYILPCCHFCQAFMFSVKQKILHVSTIAQKLFEVCTSGILDHTLVVAYQPSWLVGLSFKFIVVFLNMTTHDQLVSPLSGFTSFSYVMVNLRSSGFGLDIEKNTLLRC